MRITDLLSEQSITLNGTPKTKEEAINTMVDLMAAAGKLKDVETYKKEVLAREALSTTGIGMGIAIPHGKSDGVQAAGLAAMVIPPDTAAVNNGQSNYGVEYESMDGQPANLIFLIAAPNTEDNIHLEVLSRLSMLLMDEAFTEKLRGAKEKKEFLQIIDEAERKKFQEDDSKAVLEGGGKTETTSEAENKTDSNVKTGYRILAVTACPTGIAHTYMAAENLEKKAHERGISIKVETDGSGGAKNVLTRKEIAEADCIIIAADKNVEMARFDGKPLIKAKVADGIHKADELLDRALADNAHVYHHEGKIQESGGEDEEKESVGRIIYKHLMNGVSHMLPFVIGGGILIALAFLFDNYEMNPANFGMNTPLAAFFKTVGNTAFSFMLPILAGYIAMSIADRPGLAVGFVGGAIANAGYTFQTLTSFDSSNAVSSGFLGALLAGFAGGYLVVFLRKLFDKLPKSLEGIKPVLLYPVIGILLMGVIMIGVNPVVGAINTAMTNGLQSMGGSSKILLGAVLGGMMSIDMGGPFNKAAYVFGTAQLASNEFDVMASVMAGGMVAPLAIAICATIFKNRFAKKDRQSAYVNYIMGLSFISEGAIPFAAADPLRVLPSCIIGSAVAGALSMAFGCGLRAPHGGVFVIPTVTNPLGYLAAIAIGSVAGALLLAVLKRPVKEK